MQIDAARLEDFAAAVRPRIAGDLRLDALSRALYATDASLYREPPLGVLVPRHADDIQAALEEAGRFGVPVVARGSGSSLAGSAVAAGLVVDTTKHLREIVSLDPEARTATVQPGVVLDDLNAAARAHGLQVGPDPASSNRATIGGMLGTNATGTHSIQYGSVVDWTESARALLSDGTPVEFAPLSPEAWSGKTRAGGAEGEVYRRLDALLKVHEQAVRRDTPEHWRRAGGYRLERMFEAPEVDRGPGRPWDGTRNLAALLAGSEGTLGIATEITLGLVERPTHAVLGVVHYPTRREALEAVEGILETGPTAVELFDRIALERALNVTEYAPKLHFIQRDAGGGLPAALLIVEYSGASDAETHDGLARLRRHLGGRGGHHRGRRGRPHGRRLRRPQGGAGTGDERAAARPGGGDRRGRGRARAPPAGLHPRAGGGHDRRGASTPSCTRTRAPAASTSARSWTCAAPPRSRRWRRSRGRR